MTFGHLFILLHGMVTWSVCATLSNKINAVLNWYECVQFLIEQGADVNSVSNTGTSILVAVKAFNTDFYAKIEPLFMAKMEQQKLDKLINTDHISEGISF